MRVKVSLKLSTDLVDEARRLGLNLSRIVEAALIREVATERLRRQVDRNEDREGGDGTGSSTAET
jgi:post-segregation antitoxin (ccd killing protein)